MSGTRSSGRVTRSTLKAPGETIVLPRRSKNGTDASSTATPATSRASPSPSVDLDGNTRQDVPESARIGVKGIKETNAVGLRARRRSTVDPAGMPTEKDGRRVVEVVIPTASSTWGAIGPRAPPVCAVAGPGPRSMSLRRGGSGRRQSLVEAEMDGAPMSVAQDVIEVIKPEVHKTRTSARRREKESRLVELEVPREPRPECRKRAGPDVEVDVIEVKQEPRLDEDAHEDMITVLSPPASKRSSRISTEEPIQQPTRAVSRRRSSRVDRRASISASVSVDVNDRSAQEEEARSTTSLSEPPSDEIAGPEVPEGDTIIVTSPVVRPVSAVPKSALEEPTASVKREDADVVVIKRRRTPPARLPPSKQSVERTTRRGTSTTKRSPSPAKPLNIPVTISTPGPPRTFAPGAADPKPIDPSPIASPASHSLRSTKAQGRTPCSAPFPPADITDSTLGGMMALDQEELENGSIIQDDIKDDKLMAVCAALETFGNRALTAIEIGETCVNQGWIRPSPALPPQNLVQSAIRAYTRRCASHRPERVCLVRRHILAGYAMESRLIPALHPSAARDGQRRKGTVYFLEGTVGRRTWTSPFDNLPEEPYAGTVINVVKRNQDPALKKIGNTKQVRRGKAAVTPIASGKADSIDAVLAEDVDASKPKGLKIKIKLGGVVNGIADTSQTRFSPDDGFDTMMDRPIDSGSSTHDDSGSESDEGSEVMQDGFPQCDSDDESSEDSDDESGNPMDENGLPTTGSIKDLARSFFMDSPRPKPITDIPCNQVRFSPFESRFEPAFPSNPLDSMFDDSDYMPALSPSDGQMGSSSEDEDEVATEFMDTIDTIDFERLGLRKASNKRVGFHPMAYRDVLSPVDAEGSEIDTPATTPRTYCDEDEAETKETFVADEPLPDVDEELQNAVHVLGQLLPDLCDPVDVPIETPEPLHMEECLPERSNGVDVEMQVLMPNAKASSINSIDSSVRPRRKSSVGARDFLRLSLPLPLCPAPSPLNSPTRPDHSVGVLTSGQELSTELGQHELERKDPPSDNGRMEGTSDLELLPDLERQSANNDCESACICSHEPENSVSMDVDPISSPRDSVFAPDPEDEVNSNSALVHEDLTRSWADLLGPESVGMEELDNVWGFMNAAVAAAAVDQGKRRRRGEPDCQSVDSTKSDSSDRTLQQKDIWGTIGVGSTADTSARARRLEKTRFARVLMTRAKMANANANLTVSNRGSSTGDLSLEHQVENDEAFGMEDVADAVLAAWADGDTVLEEEALDTYSPEFAALDEDYLLRAGFQYPVIDDYAIGVSPSALTKSNEPEISQVTVEPSVSDTSISTSEVEERQPSTTTDQNAMGNISKLENSGSPHSNNKARPTTPVPGAKPGPAQLSTAPGGATLFSKLPARLPAPPRPVASSSTFVNATKPSNPPVHAMLLDNVSVFAILWGERLICRRIDSDYVNFSTLLRALRHPATAEIERKVAQHPTSLFLRDKSHGIDGVWVPLDVAETEAAAIHIPSALAAGLFREDLAALFPEPLAQIKSILGAQGKAAMGKEKIFVGGRMFGIPFGCMGQAFVKEHPKAVANIPLSLPLADTTVTSSNCPAIIPSKRLSAATTAPKSEGPPSKRRKSSVSIAPARRLTRAQKHNS